MSLVIRFVRYILFCVFFSAGTGAIVLSILVSEVNDYYANKDALIRSDLGNKKLHKLNKEYDIQLEMASRDPNIITRLERVTLGHEPESEGTIYPTATKQAIAEAEAVIASGNPDQQQDNPLKKIIDRCMEKRIRLSLFIAGSGLVLLTFLFFGAKRPPRPQKDIRFQKDINPQSRDSHGAD